MKKKIRLTKDERIKCHLIIHPAAVATGAAGVIPVGPADTFMITPIQIGMVIALGGAFGIRVSESIAKSIVGGFAASLTGRAAAKTLFQWLPVIGWAINFFTATSITETIAWIAVAHFHDIKENHSKYAGKKEGYDKAAAEYEEKFRMQAEEFIKADKVYKSERAEYVELLDNLTRMVIELSGRTDADSLNVAEKISILQSLINKLKNLRMEG